MRQDETQNGSVNRQTPAVPPVKHDWYQTEAQVIVTVMVKNVPKDGVCINFMEKELDAKIQLASGESYSLNLHLLHPIIPQQSSFKILTTKVEIKMKKTDAIRWEKLEGEGQESNIKHFNPHQYPSSSHYTCKWDKMVVDIGEEEKNENLEGDAALNKLFQQIYSDGSDEVKRAMNKSFMESGGTVLSTNWKDVGKRKVEMNPPDDVEFKKTPPHSYSCCIYVVGEQGRWLLSHISDCRSPLHLGAASSPAGQTAPGLSDLIPIEAAIRKPHPQAVKPYLNCLRSYH
ncbi:protein SGT1 homolog isoform X1 [Lates japonicus]|uniref:Protein SGT1 homolog isoform X1 n=1 Tax=Lates japonicus TaxID=270547 RepID=A0AAD3M3E7_LATJO|nr:protein SGT1 homolog isoform X1 [Lates japonicus]